MGDKGKEEEKDHKMKYLDKEKLLTIDFEDDFTSVETATNDTINEEELFDVVADSKYKEELMAAAIQMAIVGFGGRQYNQYLYKGDLKELKQLFLNAGIKHNNKLSDKLDTTTLTPRRLLRILRYQIQLYLEKRADKSSYLFNKYGDYNVKYRTICFPGGEHLVSTQTEAEYIYSVYDKLDKDLSKRGFDSGIGVRIQRVLLARGYKV